MSSSTYGTNITASSDVDDARGNSTADALCSSHVRQHSFQPCVTEVRTLTISRFTQSPDKRSLLIAVNTRSSTTLVGCECTECP